jgi:hypothetical protein
MSGVLSDAVLLSIYLFGLLVIACAVQTGRFKHSLPFPRDCCAPCTSRLKPPNSLQPATAAYIPIIISIG